MARLPGIRRNKKIDPSRLHPVMAAGLTQGRHALAEAHELEPLSDTRDGATVAREMSETPPAVDGTRIPAPRFIAEDSLDSVWYLGDDRLQRNSIQSYPAEVVRAIQTGYMCLRCNEPQPEAFPDICDLCHYPMKDRQVMDFAMEFEGTRHFGPARPISEYLMDLEAEQEKREFEKRQTEGGRGIIVPGARRTRDAS